MKIGFTGSQSGMNDSQRIEVMDVIDHMKPIEVHHGDCIGSDETFHWLFVSWHKMNDMEPRKIVIHPPIAAKKMALTWMTHNLDKLKKATEKCQFKITVETREPYPYLRRNQHIVDECDILIATPKEIEHTLRSGTWATIRYAWLQKKQVITVPPVIIKLGERS